MYNFLKYRKFTLTEFAECVENNTTGEVISASGRVYNRIYVTLAPNIVAFYRNGNTLEERKHNMLTVYEATHVLWARRGYPVKAIICSPRGNEVVKIS